MRRMWRVAATVAVLVAAQVAVVGSGTAAASAGVEMVVARSATDSDSLKVVSARCPLGKKVLGGGGRIFDGEGFVTLARLVPDSDHNQYLVWAVEDFYGYDADWDVEAYAICGETLPGLEYVSASTFAEPGSTYVEVTATCPAGKRAVGAGGMIGLGDFLAGASFQGILPFEYSNGGNVVARSKYDERLNNPLGFPLVAMAVCAYPPPGYEIRYVTMPQANTAPYGRRLLQASAPCSPGKKVLGAGLGGADGYGTARLDAMFPAWDRGGAAVVARQPSTDHPFLLSAAAICAN
jgi:hypothetical protein